ncbi:MAG: DUF1206 domain-containing protein [Ilumatobacteraceae bacterium]
MAAVEVTLDDTSGVAARTASLSATLPESFDDIDAALKTVETLSGAIDAALGGLSRVPFGPDYDPDVPLPDAVRNLRNAFAPIGDDLRSISTELQSFADGSDEVGVQIETVRADLRDTRSALAASAGLLEDYRVTAREAGLLASTSRDDTARGFALARLGLLLLAAFIVVAQYIPGGWRDRGKLVEFRRSMARVSTPSSTEPTVRPRAAKVGNTTMSGPSDSDGGASSDVEDATEKVADKTQQTINRHPWIQTVGQMGWVAKGIVYLLMGATATQIARQESSDDEASPSGALNRVMEQPGGRILLLVMAVGLLLYFLWRIFSVAIIRDNDLSAWAHRVGYTFSALFYALLAFTAFRTVMRGAESGKSNTVEKLSRSLLGSTLGRGAVILAGAITIAVGLYFIVRKGIMRGFVDELHTVDESADDALDWGIIVAGVAGWVGRGIVTGLVGVLVARAAINFDPEDARGFDGALRKVATTTYGTTFVWVSAIGLMLYGAFCLLSHRYRYIEDNT